MSRRALLIAVVVAVVGGVAPSALAAQERSGDQFVLSIACLNENSAIKVVDTPLAGEPFHIAHGWRNAPSDVDDLGQYDFDLWIDGEPQKGKLDVTVSHEEHGTELQRTFVQNYPEGLSSGSHTIRAVWSDPTGIALDCEWDVYFLDPATEDVGVSVDLACEDGSTRLTVRNDGTEAVFVELFGRDGETEELAESATLNSQGDELSGLLDPGWQYEWQAEYPIGTHIYDNGGGTIGNCA
jgi:hypothetical protein